MNVWSHDPIRYTKLQKSWNWLFQGKVHIDPETEQCKTLALQTVLNWVGVLTRRITIYEQKDTANSSTKKTNMRLQNFRNVPFSTIVPVWSTSTGVRPLSLMPAYILMLQVHLSRSLSVTFLDIFSMISTTKFTPYEWPSTIRRKTEPALISEGSIAPVVFGPVAVHTKQLQTISTLKPRKWDMHMHNRSSGV